MNISLYASQPQVSSPVHETPQEVVTGSSNAAHANAAVEPGRPAPPPRPPSRLLTQMAAHIQRRHTDPSSPLLPSQSELARWILSPPAYAKALRTEMSGHKHEALVALARAAVPEVRAAAEAEQTRREHEENAVIEFRDNLLRLDGELEARTEAAYARIES